MIFTNKIYFHRAFIFIIRYEKEIGNSSKKRTLFVKNTHYFMQKYFFIFSHHHGPHCLGEKLKVTKFNVLLTDAKYTADGFNSMK